MGEIGEPGALRHWQEAAAHAAQRNRAQRRRRRASSLGPRKAGQFLEVCSEFEMLLIAVEQRLPKPTIGFVAALRLAVRRSVASEATEGSTVTPCSRMSLSVTLRIAHPVLLSRVCLLRPESLHRY